MTCLSNWTDAAEELSLRGKPVPAIALDARRLEAAREEFRKERVFTDTRSMRALRVLERRRRLLGLMEKKAITPVEIVAEELKRLGLTGEIFARVGKKGGMSRKPELVAARGHLFIVLLERGMSYPAIARACGMKGHSGIYDAVAKVKRDLRQAQATTGGAL